MSTLALLILLIGLGIVAWVSARLRLSRLAGEERTHSLPLYHGWYVALWTAVPPILFLILWVNITPALVSYAVIDTPVAARILPSEPLERSALLAEARALAKGQIEAPFNADARLLAPAYAETQSRYDLGATALALILAFAGFAYAFTRVRPDFRARTRVERIVMAALLGASLVAILTTVGIVASLLFESFRFFSMVNPLDFLFGTRWSPQATVLPGEDPGFGAVPLFWGTIFIGAIIAMLVAIPLGLMSAVYLTQYARPAVRRWMKPILEILAGVPTVVYGYFAALTVAPVIRDAAAAIGIANASSESALAAGLVMGIMIIPFVSSMADDSIAAVPGSMRDGSLAMGATSSETIRRVLIPAALPGVVGGVLLAVSRAIGETMIVVMAAGLAANLTANPFASVTTVTTQIVQLLTGDQEFDSAKTLAAFALGLVLFVVTLLLNIVALRVVKRYREAYE
ncbi:phosphate transport system permease protein [Sphingomonas jejuensis]|uniref:Phosphate transport system permease protein n=1 Tax=Sphingomonas jejuensis TaxID=904715 RepID=A0ABX0XL05_9SPHN|nr:phosphate ABC transporter permease subunit PstC [Sphingomonas jejuensis]NJC34046.1 phosphate transport system permease protein [Sphingomonas jejuensis]